MDREPSTALKFYKEKTHNATLGEVGQAIVYHMTRTDKLMTELEVLEEVVKYKKSWPDDLLDEECSLIYVRNALIELERVGLQECWWFDGICKKCGNKVIERGAHNNSNADYENMCTDEQCKEHKLHYCGDDEFLDYYEHTRGEYRQ